ncbi:CGNR zinc finger domain-containing protein [Solirubrobacter phytolaccae]|uniref:CGNR zinc finger domain-containing protein n=1 Tax=Solirubrobacter phytolaccae TaxID=1404360 RepID=A0A9X3NFQ0_9ACTN|nr:CGNR zinc finger domain-containing protein [Solirubrobacter phytolaccae]MDA0184170.1 CGNR zinc finger domain-containing protein [Solirubrobacter phytolaccae]
MHGMSTGRRLQDPKGGSFWFDAGAVCLDFAHTGGEGDYAIFESLHAPSDFTTWLAELGVVVDALSDADLVAAKTLRQAIWEVAHAQADGVALPAEAVAIINAAAIEPPLVPQLGTGWAPPVTASQVRSALARELIELLSGPLATRFRECASDNCPLVFVDASRPGTRRWCSMERCGNRSKLRAHRARHAP